MGVVPRGSPELPTPRVEATPIRDSQALFTYRVSTRLDREPRVHDPVVVLPDGSRLLSDADYTAYATQQAVVFRDGDHVREILNGGAGTSDDPADGRSNQASLGGAAPDRTDSRLSDYVLAVNPVAENAAIQYRDAVRDMRLRSFNMVATLAILGLTATSVALVYCRRNAQQLFVKYLCGWSFARAYRPLLLVEGLVASALIAWTLLRIRTTSGGAETGAPVPRSERAELALGGGELLVAVAVTVVSVGFVVAALVRFNARMVKEQTAEV